VGVYVDLDGGVALHCREKKGVLCQRVGTLRSQLITNVKYYCNRNWTAPTPH
jgi:hypothetical protein